MGAFGFEVRPSRHRDPRRAPSRTQDVKGAPRPRRRRRERLRLYYVAMTRAMERLIVSGSIGAAGDGSEETPIGWVLSRLELEDEARRSVEQGPVEVERGAATVLLRLDRGQPDPVPVTGSEPDAAPVPEIGQLALFEGSGEALPPPAPRLRELTVVPEPPHHRVSRLSYSALALFERCSYRYYAERVAGMRPVPWGAAEESGGGLHPTEIGDAAHRLLERIDLASPARPRTWWTWSVPGTRR